MTGPVTTEALVEALTQFLLDRSGETLWQCEARAKAIIAGPLAPLLAAHQQQSASIGSLEESVNGLEAAHQQVTAERDEAQDLAYELKLAAAGGEDAPGSANLVTPADVRRWRDEDTRQLATATSELARLRAEGEAKDRRIAVLEAALAPFAKAGELFGPRLSDDYDQSIYAPAAGPEFAITADHLRAARAATAREG